MVAYFWLGTMYFPKARTIASGPPKPGRGALIPSIMPLYFLAGSSPARCWSEGFEHNRRGRLWETIVPLDPRPIMH